VECRIRKIVDAIADGVPARSLKDELLTLEQRQAELARILAQPYDRKPLIHPNLAEAYRRKVTDLHAALQQDEMRTDAAEIIRSLIDEITLTPDGGQLRINLRGELAGILALVSNSKKPDLLGSGSEQIKVVAGTRNQPTETVKGIRW
jgi:site-specific DNA recombinase